MITPAGKWTNQCDGRVDDEGTNNFLLIEKEKRPYQMILYDIDNWI